MKELMEKRNALIVEMEGLLATAKTETRAFNETETERIEAVKAEIKGIDNTIKVEEELRNMDKKTEVIVAPVVEQRELDDANFLKFVRGEERALDIANNGGVIPVSIANKIIEAVKELSPIYSMVTIYNVGGDLVFPVYDETTPIAAAYTDDMVELVEATGKFTTITLTNFIVGVLAKISKSLMNRTDFDLVGFIVNKVATSIAEFLEKECLIGTSAKMTGVFSSTNIVTTAINSAITADELIDLQDTVPDALQGGACWIMSKSTRKAIRKLKNLDGEYLLNKDITTPFGYALLGKPVYVSKNAADIATTAKVIAYGDMSGLYVKLAQNVEIQMLTEKYATQHAIGVVGYIECDSKIVEPQKLAVLQMIV